MSFSSADLEIYCDYIVKRAALEQHIVVLCEGYNENLKPIINGQSLGIADNFAMLYQDASFYQRAIPKWWRETKKAEPVFYICGTQSQVIDTYFSLQKKYQNLNDKRLNSNKIFALIDIDLQQRPIEYDYPFKSLEAIYNDLYVNGKVNEDTAKNHKIWVTGLLHKEAYFIIPEVEEIIKNNQPQVIFNNQQLNELNALYQKIISSLSNDKLDIKTSFSITKERLKHCQNLYNSQSITEFQNICLDALTNSEITLEEKQNSIYAILTIAKSKAVWEKIKFSIESPDHKKHKEYRDDLSFKIAREFYAQEDRNSRHHLPRFFNALSAHS